MIGSLRTSTSFIIGSGGRVIGLESCKFNAFIDQNDKIIVCNDMFELKDESECRYYCDILSMAIDATTYTPASTVHFDAIDIESFQISAIGFNLCGVLSPTIPTATSIKNENEMKYESGPTQTQIQMQSQHAPHPANKPFDIYPTDAVPREFDDLEYMFGALLSEDGFNFDRNKVFKYKILVVIMFVIYYASAGMLLFNFFLVDTIHIHRVAYELVLFLFLI